MRSNRTVSYFRQFLKQAGGLTGKERIILIRRLNKSTLEKIGEKFGLTEGRIRQIERQAINRLKNGKVQLPLFKK